MKKHYFLTILSFLFFGVSAQLPLTLPEYFEMTEVDTNWVQFANAGDAPENLDLAENPDKFGINPSDSCLKLVVLDEADAWAGIYTDAYEEIEITEENYIIEIMIYKNVLTPARMKLEQGTTDDYTVTVESTVTDFWEILSFDFTEVIGHSFARYTIFPDRPSSRESGSICYIDNIAFRGTLGPLSTSKFKTFNVSVYPNPASEVLSIRSKGITSATITNLVGKNIRSCEYHRSDYEMLDIAGLANGVYFLTLNSDAGKTVHKFVKR